MTAFLERIFLVCGVVLILDLAFFGPGLVLPGVGFSLRRLLLLVMLVVAALRRSQLSPPFSSDDLTLIACVVLLVGLWAVVLPVSYGYSRSQSFADAAPWLGLVVLSVWPWSAWPRQAQWKRFCRFLLIVGVVLAAMHILIWAFVASGVVSADLLSITARLVAPTDGDAEGFIRVGEMQNGQYRVYWSSSIFLLGSIYFLAAYRPRPLTKAWSTAFLLISFALWTTYIRAFLGAVAIFLALTPILRRALAGGSVLTPKFKIMAVWIAGVICVGVAINPILLEALGLSRDVSDVERVSQASALLERFLAHPLLGTGFGSYASAVIRTEGAPYSYELVFHALLMKLGVVGMGVLLLTLYLALRVAGLTAAAQSSPRKLGLWAAFTTGFWFAGATNPMVTNFVGMAVLVLLIVDTSQWQSERGQDTQLDESMGDVVHPVR